MPRLSAVYREILKLEPEEANIFETIPTEGAVLSIYSSKRTENAAPGCLEGSGNGRYTIEFEVEDVDREYQRLKDMNVEIVKPPTTQPWGRRSVWFRDPDRNIANFYANVQV
ncbi:MAG: VOC family protein [Gemmatimonadota bacterium]|nr:VOC family protein [Gemmatimonadota bacterium]